MPGGS